MKKILLATAAVLSLAAGTPLHAAEHSWSGVAHYRPDAGQTVFTGRSSVVTTGRIGSMQTTTLPGGGGGILENNGNGTSTLIGPGTITTVPTPR